MFRVAILLGFLTTAAHCQQGVSFREDFNDGLSEGFWYISDGWFNGEHQNCLWSKDAVGVAGGFLRLRFSPENTGNRAYICGEVRTKKRYGYGTYEARFRTPKGSGINAAFFTYIGPHQNEPHDEIDFEVLTRDTSRVSLNTYVAAEPHHGAEVPVTGGADTQFHTYSFIWEPNRLRWFVDGELLHQAGPPLPSHPQNIMLSLWGTNTLTDWMGPFYPPSAPLVMEVDWIAYTDLGEACQFEASVLCALK